MSVVLVTGSSSGIGLATAIHFGRSGWEVYAGLRDLATATELHQTIATEKLPIRPLALDVNDDASVTRGVGEVLTRAGGIDVLVNNAGIGGGGPIEDVPVDWVKGLFETNSDRRGVHRDRASDVRRGVPDLMRQRYGFEW